MRCTRCGNNDHGPNDTRCRVCGRSLPPRAGKASARTGSGWRETKTWKRFLFQRLDAAPVEMKEGETFAFGRASECDVVIQSPNVSRRHAEVTWREGRPVLRDLGSQNGTLVNGKPIREHPLEDRDEISLGPFTCTFRLVSGRGSVREEQALHDSQADTQAMLAIAMAGELEEMSVYEVLETLTYHQKTGTLEMYSPWDVEGRVAMKDGVVLRAEVESFRGEQALYSLLAWTEGRFRFVTGLDPDLRPNVRTPIARILAEVSRQPPPGKPSTPGQGH